MIIGKEEKLSTKSWFKRSGEEVRSNRKVINTLELRGQASTVHLQRMNFFPI